MASEAEEVTEAATGATPPEEAPAAEEATAEETASADA